MKKRPPQAKDARGLLRERKLRATPARIAVLALLVREGAPIGVMEALKKLKSSAGDQATVYRIFDSLERAGLVRRVDLRHAHVDFEYAGLPDHHHLVCLTCGRHEDFTGCEAERLSKTALQRSKIFKRVIQHAIELYGYCRSCDRKKSPAR